MIELYFVGLQGPEGLQLCVLEAERSKRSSSGVAAGCGRLQAIAAPGDAEGSRRDSLSVAWAILAHLLCQRTLQACKRRKANYRELKLRTNAAIRRAEERAPLFRADVVERLPAHGWVLPSAAVWEWLGHEATGQDVLDRVTALAGQQEVGAAVSMSRRHPGECRRTWR